MQTVTNRQSNLVPVLMRTLDILEFLCGSDIPLKSNEISNATGVPLTTTYRIMQTLLRRGCVAQDMGGRFSILSLPAKGVISSRT